MWLYKVIVLFVVVLFPATKSHGVPSKHRIADASFSGFSLEMILTKLAYLQEKLVNMELTITKDREMTDRKLSHHGKLSEGLLLAVQQMNHTLTAQHVRSESALIEYRDSIDQMLSHQGTLSEELLSSIDHIDQKFTLRHARSESALKEFRDLIEQKLSHHAQSSSELMFKMNESFKALQSQSKMDRESIENKLHGINETINTMNTRLHEKLSEIQTQLKEKDNVKLREENVTLPSKDNLVRPRDDVNASILSCSKAPSQQSGIYNIQPAGYIKPFAGYCVQDSFGGGWLLVQYRFDGSEDFRRTWKEYRNGFGRMDREFWLGSEHLHRLTSARPHELLVELKDFEGVYKYAQYSEIQIGSEQEEYNLQKLGSYKGTAGDSFANIGAKFVTKDRGDHGKCLPVSLGWWCLGFDKANLNGNHRNSKSNGLFPMYWYTFNDIDDLVYSRIMIREI